MTTPTHVTITRRFAASPARVFDAWLDPARIQVWMAPGSEAVVRVSVDARVGGRFSFVVRRQGQEIDHVGEYLELDRPRRLVFTWGVPQFSSEMTVVTLDFTPVGAGTELVLTHDRVLPEYATRTAAGWNRICDALAASIGLTSDDGRESPK